MHFHDEMFRNRQCPVFLFFPRLISCLRDFIQGMFRVKGKLYLLSIVLSISSLQVFGLTALIVSNPSSVAARFTVNLNSKEICRRRVGRYLALATFYREPILYAEELFSDKGVVTLNKSVVLALTFVTDSFYEFWVAFRMDESAKIWLIWEFVLTI